MFALTMLQKAALAGVGVLAVGAAAGYGAGVVKERGEVARFREGNGAMMRDGSGYGTGPDRQDMGGPASDGRGNGNLSAPRDAEGNVPGNGRGDVNRGNCLSDDCLRVDGLEYPAGELSPDGESAIRAAIDDEYKALATYEAVMAKFGRVRPFVMIARAEEQHISSLKAIFDKYGVDAPENPYLGKITAPDSLQASCQAGVDAEIANAALYRDALFPKVSGYPDIEGVFENLMNASQEKHLPAFERCR